MSSDDSIHLTRAQVREVDRRAIEDYGIPGIVLMENAGGNAASLVLGWTPTGRTVAIVCGRGNNGGDGFVIARHLFNAGVGVELFLACDPRQLTGDAATNARIAEKMALATQLFDTPERIERAGAALGRAGVIVDAILGTGFSGQVRSPLDAAIEAINRAGAGGGAMVVAVDLPSGLDCDTGVPSNATVRAGHTITFVARKAGFAASGAAAYTGEVHVAAIGAPRTLVQEILGAASG
jgi:NAD(P)H-hydrate epimerase